MFLLIQCRLFYDSSILFSFFYEKKESNRQPIIIYSDKSADCRWKLFSRPVERNREASGKFPQFLSSSCVKRKGWKKAIVSNYIAREY